jgi:hypothetical protein
MTAQEELLYLKHILRNLEADVPSFITSGWLPIAGWVSAVGYFLLLFQIQTRISVLLFALLVSFGGVIAGALAFWRVCASKWPYVRPHIDPSSVEQRVRELES